MPTVPLPDRDHIDLLKRLERHFLQGITRIANDFGWHEELRHRLESLLEGRLALRRLAETGYLQRRGPGLEEWLESEE